jgi:hypothetical protein
MKLFSRSETKESTRDQKRGKSSVHRHKGSLNTVAGGLVPNVRWFMIAISMPAETFLPQGLRLMPLERVQDLV